MDNFVRGVLLATAIGMLASGPVSIQPVVSTESLPSDVDDPSVWVHPTDHSRSLIVGTVKRPKADGGSLAVYSLDGKVVQRIMDLDRPNNVDILGDICVTTERLARQILVYRVHGEYPHLRPIGSFPVFEGEAGEAGAPMGIALYQRSRDKALFAIVSRKTGPKDGYLWQYQLKLQGGQVQATKVRAFGAFSGEGEIEAVAVDQKSQRIYYSDENCCVRAYLADPNAAGASSEITSFAKTGFKLNREGIAVAGRFVIVTDQLIPGSEYHFFDRKTLKEVAIYRGVSESTDGLDAIALPMGPSFPKGFLVAMNNRSKNFDLYAWPVP